MADRSNPDAVSVAETLAPGPKATVAPTVAEEPGFWSERGRHVTRVAIGYGAASLASLKVVTTLIPALHLPEWALTVYVVAAILGFPVAVVFAWLFQFSSGGIVRRPAAVKVPTVLLASLLAVMVVGAGVAAWQISSRLAVKGAEAPSSEAVASATSLAVLPFVNIGGDPANEYFSDGMTEELLNALAHAPGLRVAARTSSFAFKGKAIDAREVANTLGVLNIVEGSVRRDGTRLRVTAQLIQASSGFELWSESFDRQLSDAFKVQDELAHAIAQALSARLGAGSAHNPPIAAYDQYLRGRFAFNTLTQEGLTAGLGFYRRALEIDPGYALPWAGIAETYMWLADEWMPPGEAYPRAKEAAQAAVRLAPDLAAGHVFLGTVLLIYDWDFAASHAELERARTLAPRDANVLFYTSNWQLVVHGPKEAIPAILEAQKLDPLSPVMSDVAGLWLLWGRDYTGALEQDRRTRELDPNFRYFGSVAGDAYRELGQFDRAYDEYAREEALLGRPSWGLAVTYARAGREADARKILSELIALSKTMYIAPDRIAAIYAALGDMDRTFEWLDRGVANKATWLTWIRVQPEFDSIRGDARYPVLLRRVGWP